MNGQTIALLILVIVGLNVGCREHYTPKARGYYRIALPDKEYMNFDSDYPYRFEYPAYANINPDTSSNAEQYWLNIAFRDFKGQIHLSYKPIGDNFSMLMEDSRKLAYKHSIKADAIKERAFHDEEMNVTGVLYEIIGDAASPIQFYATDSLHHFIRGSLYFNVVPNQDSLAPVIDFVHQDVIHLMETLRWNN